MGESLRWILRGLVSDERIAVVPNGSPEPEPSSVVRDPCHVVFLSNLRRRKGVAEAVEAALIVMGRQPSARFSFVGSWESDQLEQELRRRAQSANGAIVFFGPVGGSAKDDLLASAAILMFPPLEPEGHPRVVLEALAAGIPVVSTDRGAIAETVEDGRCGFIVDEPVPEVLADRVLTLLEDDALRDAMSRAARERYLSSYTQEIADQVLSSWLSELD
jgi:glycosyltransferase involved in cell wall biosynthesis